MRSPLAVVRGGGDLATGTINRLFKSGFRVIVLEIKVPTMIRLSVSAATAVFDENIIIEDVRYQYVKSAHEALELTRDESVPVLVDPNMDSLRELKPDVLIDATLAKRNMGIHMQLAPIVIGLGPGFTAGEDCHAVIETSRGHDLGVIIYSGSALPNTGIPGLIAGYAEERVIRAPGSGYLKAIKKIGDLVTAGECIGSVNDAPVLANIEGVLRGLIHESVPVSKGMKIGDVDPRANIEACTSISDKARALGGSVLEAYLSLSGVLNQVEY